MAIIPKLETVSFHECSEQLDGQKKWVENIDLSKDSGTWRDSIDLPADMGNSAPSVEKADLDLSRFEESKQVERMVDYLDRLPEVKRENWLNLSFEDRVRAVQKIETQAAKVGCRPALTVKAESMSSGNLGYMDWKTQKIAINEDLLRSISRRIFDRSSKQSSTRAGMRINSVMYRWNAQNPITKSTKRGP